MGLSYDATGIENFDTLIKDERNKVIYEALIWGTMGIDFGNTAADPDEFVWRVMFYEAVLGPLTYQVDEDNNMVRNPLTDAEIRQFAGLRTNVFNTTRTQFVNRTVKTHRQEHGFKVSR